MIIIEILLSMLTIIILLSTLGSAFNHAHWLTRVSDFPRLQVLVLACLCAAAWILDLAFLNEARFISPSLALITLGLAITYQAIWIFPYFGLLFKEVDSSSSDLRDDKKTSIKLLSSNVLQTNTRYEDLIQLVNEYCPDLLITLETNSDWEQALSRLHSDYPHRIAIPQENLYGMHLYSRFPIEKESVLFRIRDDIPSIKVSLIVEGLNVPIELHCVHPMPPSPTEAETSTERDQELIQVAKAVVNNALPTIVAGDLNDVAWSRSTRLFKKLSGLKDPRVGRGFFNTFNANYPFLRWPLDHVFVSSHFSVKKIKVLPKMGSDHFPIYIELDLDAEVLVRRSNEDEDLNPAEEALLTEREAS